MERSILRKIAEARASGGGQQITDGKFSLLVRNLLLEQKHTGMCFIAELTVETSERVFDDVEPNRPGTQCSYVVNLDGAGKLSAPGNIKALVLAILGLEEAEVSNDQLQVALESLISEKQPARGMRIGASTYRKFARTGPNSKPDAKGRPPMVMVKWEHIEQSDADVKRRRAELDAVK